MFSTLPKDPKIFLHMSWKQIKPYAEDLMQRPLTQATLSGWVMNWSDLGRMISEMYSRLRVATTVDTSDKEAKDRLNTFLDDIYIPTQEVAQALKKKLLSSGLKPIGFETALRNMQVEVEIFSEPNLPLQAEERKLANEYDEIISGQTVEWDGCEVTITQLQPVFRSQDRAKREKAWRLEMERQLADRQNLNELWVKLKSVRDQIARNAGFADYRGYRWKDLLRFDYTPEDCFEFHQAIEKVVVPAAGRICAKRQRRLGLSSLRPWDMNTDPLGREALKPFQTIDELVEKTAAIFHRVDPELGNYFGIMRDRGLLDLENRKGKAPGAYCADFNMVRLPFIFENAVGLHEDVDTLLHEAGHAFHMFESSRLPYFQQLQVGIEFSEVASTAMELLGAPYLSTGEAGFYSNRDAARARIEHLEDAVLFWPYMAVVDAFQHWAYEFSQLSTNPSNCDKKWRELWQRYMVWEDWSGLEDQMITGWQRKLHIFEDPFYYIEYGLASLGAIQVWTNALRDQSEAVRAYRRALALGGTVPLPQLYETAGAKFSFSAETLHQAVNLIETQIERLEKE